MIFFLATNLILSLQHNLSPRGICLFDNDVMLKNRRDIQRETKDEELVKDRMPRRDPSSFSFLFFHGIDYFFALLITVPPSPKQVRAAPRSRFRPVVPCIPECCTSAISVHYVHTPVHCYIFVSANYVSHMQKRQASETTFH